MLELEHLLMLQDPHVAHFRTMGSLISWKSIIWWWIFM